MDAIPARTAPCLPALRAEGNARPLATALAALLALLRILLGPAAHQAFRALLASPAFLPRLRAALAAGTHPTEALWSRRVLSPAQRRRAHARLAALRTKQHVALPARTRRPGLAAIRRIAARLRALAHGIWLALPPYPPAAPSCPRMRTALALPRGPISKNAVLQRRLRTHGRCNVITYPKHYLPERDAGHPYRMNRLRSPFCASGATRSRT